MEADELDDRGFVVDFADLDAFKNYLDDRFDHRHLNDVLEVAPTSENLARHFYEWSLKHLSSRTGTWVAAVRVSETPSTWAEFTRQQI